MWSKYPENKPGKSGYYMTYYYNHLKDGYFHKAIYYNNNSNKWISWKPGLEPMVFEYEEDTYDEWYCPCVEKYEKQMNKLKDINRRLGKFYREI